MKQIIKTEALINAKNALKAYLKENRLNPLTDWRKDKVHGKEVTRLVNKLNLERDKVLDNYPYDDLKNEIKIKTIKTMSKDKKKVLKKAVSAEAPKKETKKEVTKKAVTTKYDYPLVDGREMTKEEKKKYRTEQRKKANGSTPKVEKKEKVSKEAPKAEKKAKKLQEKPIKEKGKNLKKKVKKEED